MKNRGHTRFWLTSLILIVIALAGIACATAAPLPEGSMPQSGANEASTANNGYVIQEVMPGLMKIVVGQPVDVDGMRGPGDAFDRALQELTHSYFVGTDMTPIVYGNGAGSYTRELLVPVEPR